MSEVVPEEKSCQHPLNWYWFRRIIQVSFFVAFFLLLFITVQGITSNLPTTLFFHLDPLIGVTSMLAGRSWIIPFFLGLVTIFLTLLLGRVWCGWICPLGTILDWIPSRRYHPQTTISPIWSQGKFLLLFVILISAVLGSLMFMVFDPLTLLFRTTAVVVIPGTAHLIHGLLHWLYGFTVFQPFAAWADSVLRGWLLNNQPFYLPNLFILLCFAFVLGLNVLRPRFWCRYFCPLGGLFGLIARVSFIRHQLKPQKCISCSRCAQLCPTGAVNPGNGYIADPAECIVCLYCYQKCPTHAITFAKKREKAFSVYPDSTRRWLLTSAVVAAVAAVVARFLPLTAASQERFIRPPGSTTRSLYSQCIRCGGCARICPTGVIQPDLSVNPTQLWIPSLNTRIGYCSYSCNSCGVICPTGAISGLTLPEKRNTVIGIARIDQTRCITWAEKRDCIVCEEMCPVPAKAVRLESGGQGRGAGGVRHPRVIPDMCIGCGTCEHQCPVAGAAAIQVFPVEK